MADTQAHSLQTIASFYGIKGKKLQRYYRDKLSEFKTWEFKNSAYKCLIFPENIGARLSIDETSLSHGELYTGVTNKEAKVKAGTLVAILEGTKSDNIIPL